MNQATDTAVPFSYGKIFLNAIFAGLFIGIAGTVYLAAPNRTLGAFLFGFGLLVILCYEFKLFTGAIGYCLNQGNNSLRYAAALCCIWIGNFIGCWIVGSLIRFSGRAAAISSAAMELTTAKAADSPLSLLILGFFCGILMYVAVESFRLTRLHAGIRLLIVFLCVSIFILCGFEHCIADMYYFSAAGAWQNSTVWRAVLLITLGNAIGGVLIPLGDRFRY